MKGESRGADNVPVRLLLDVLQDARYGWRRLWLRPAFAGIAILTLGLGLAVTTTLFTVVNAFVKPLVQLLSLPLLILTLGLFTLVVNALMLLITAWLSEFTDYGLTVEGFWTAFWGALIISIVNWVLGLLVPDRK